MRHIAKFLRPVRGRAAVLGRYALGYAGRLQGGPTNAMWRAAGMMSIRIEFYSRYRVEHALRSVPITGSNGFLPPHCLASVGGASIVFLGDLADSPSDDSRPSSAQHSFVEEIALGRAGPFDIIATTL